MVSTYLGWRCLHIFRSGLCSFVDQQTKKFHQKITSSASILQFMHCEEKCFPCKVVHNKISCAKTPFNHADPKHNKCAICHNVECGICKISHCRVCQTVDQSKINLYPCRTDNLEKCIFCLKEFCTSCADIKCGHTQRKCQNCKFKHCEQETANVHSGVCEFKTCQTCKIHHCKLCWRLDCFDCTCDSIDSKHKKEKCPAPINGQCECPKQKLHQCITKSSSCGIFYDEIVKNHWSGEPNFKNVKPCQWKSSYWEVIKCFQSFQTECAKKTDVSGLINICLFNIFIRRKIIDVQKIKDVSIK